MTSRRRAVLGAVVGLVFGVLLALFVESQNMIPSTLALAFLLGEFGFGGAVIGAALGGSS